MAKQSRSPNWNGKTRELVGDLTEDFRENLRRLTIRLARHERADNIEVRHVDEAYEALCTVGIKRRIWWKRPELEVAVGAFIVTLAFSASDITTVVGSILALKIDQQYSVAAGLFVGGLIAGTALTVHGWIRGNN